MTSRVLIADDSLTIQKVIGITLANSGYELVECVNEEELFRKVQSNHFDLILLDFNLSDSRSGYELSKQINNIMPGAAIIVMIGTFDSIDEGQFSSCGIADKIIKPFESSKFIKKCRDLLEGVRPAPVIEPKNNVIMDVLDEKSDDLDLWKVDAPSLMNKADKADESHYVSETKSLDPLASEIEGWGFATSNYLEDKFHKTFPPPIEESIDSGSIISKFEKASFSFSAEDVDNDETDPAFEIPSDLNRGLLNEIDEDISAESFWAVDEVVAVKSNEHKDILETNLDEITADLTETINFFNESQSKAVPEQTKTVQENTKHAVDHEIIHMDQDELVEKLKISLRPMIEQMVREFCRQNAEKIAWEVIPDLAENLIRKEIKEISDSVKH